MADAEGDVPHDLSLEDALARVRENDDSQRATRTISPAPELSDAALYGPIGEYVRHVAKTTEASPAAILATAVAATGCLIGRGPTWMIDGAPHHTRFFVLLVGPTSSGRKSTAMNHGARRLLGHVDDVFAQFRITGGLASGEGLMDALRDATPDGVNERGKKVPGDPGVADKRLLILEDETGGTFQKIARQGNNLSAVLREAWDGRTLRTLTRSNKLVVTDPHIAYVGCITPKDLRESLQSVEVMNGLANRFLFIWTERVRLLPHGEDAAELPAALGRALTQAIDQARRVHHMGWTQSGKDLWSRVYPELTAPAVTGALAALLARGAPQVRRLAMMYAALDGENQVDRRHLEAALALWEYCAASVRFVYQSADALSARGLRILEALHEAAAAGLSRDQIRRVIGSNNVTAEAISQELSTLREAGLAHAAKQATSGRPREVWRHAHFLGQHVTAAEAVINETDHSTIVPPTDVVVSTHSSHFPTEIPNARSGPGLERYDWSFTEAEAA